MPDDFDYSIHYKRYHQGTLQELEHNSVMYERWIGPLMRQHAQSEVVLDYGCGFGSLTYFLQKYFISVKGIDASLQQIEVAKNNNLPVEFLSIADFTNWCNKNTNTFDIIFLFDVLEHIPANQQITFTRQLIKTLKQNGTIYIKVPNANSLLANRWRYIDWTHHSSFTESSLDFVCLNAGLANIEYFNDDSSVIPRLPWLPRWSLRGFYLRQLIRFLWKLYLRAELGREAISIKVGINLFARAKKV